MPLVNGQDHPEQVGQGVPEPLIGEFVPHPPALRDGHDQTAPAKAGQVVGQALP